MNDEATDTVEHVGMPPENAPEPGQIDAAYMWFGFACFFLLGMLVKHLLGGGKAAVKKLESEKSKLVMALEDEKVKTSQVDKDWRAKLAKFNAQADTVAQEKLELEASLQKTQKLNDSTLSVCREYTDEIERQKAEIEKLKGVSARVERAEKSLKDLVAERDAAKDALNKSEKQLAAAQADLKAASKSPTAKELGDLARFKERWAQTSNSWKKTIDSKVRRAKN